MSRTGQHEGESPEPGLTAEFKRLDALRAEAVKMLDICLDEQATKQERSLACFTLVEAVYPAFFEECTAGRSRAERLDEVASRILAGRMAGNLPIPAGQDLLADQVVELAQYVLDAVDQAVAAEREADLRLPEAAP